MFKVTTLIYILILVSAIYGLRYIGISFSIPKLLLGIGLIVAGIQMTLSSVNLPAIRQHTDYSATFAQSVFSYPNTRNTNIFYTIFSKSEFDLSKIDISRGDVVLRLNLILGELHLTIDPSIPLVINSENIYLSKIIQSEQQQTNPNQPLRPTRLILNINSLASRIFIIPQKGYGRY